VANAGEWGLIPVENHASGTRKVFSQKLLKCSRNSHIFTRVAPDMIFSNLAGAGFGRIRYCKSGWGRMFFELRAYMYVT